MSNWDMPPTTKVESLVEKYRERIGIAQRFIRDLGVDYVNSGSYQDKFENIELADGRMVTIKLGLRNLERHPEDLLRVYAQDHESKIAWETLSYGDKYTILHATHPNGDMSVILGE